MIRAFKLGMMFFLMAAGFAGATDKLLGQQVESFRLQDFRGAWHSLSEILEGESIRGVAVIFLGVECPMAKLYAGRLQELSEQFNSRGIPFLAIDSNRQDAVTEMAAFARQSGLSFPFLKDLGNQVADAFGATRTPEVFLLDRDRRIVYHGRIDDQYGVGIARPEARTHEMRDALEDLAAGRAIRVANTEFAGCLIGRVKKPSEGATVNYSQHVAPILQQRCVECHRPGQIAPFSLTSYDEVVGWADMIREVVDLQRMPPWHANPEYGHFDNDARLSEEEKEILFTWIESGAAEGDPANLPAPIEYPEGWRLPRVDAVYSMERSFHVPATGEIPYQYFVIDPQLTEDKWIQGAECLPGARSVVHHIIAFVMEPEMAAKDHMARAAGLFNNFLVATAPGAPPMLLPEGKAKLIKAGSKLVFQMHYTAAGVPAEDRSSIALMFADPQKVTHQVVTRSVAERDLAIPPHAENHRVESRLRFSEDTLLIEFLPHMHLRGKAFRYTAYYPDGGYEILLDIPNYDFNWQNTYLLAEPKLMPKGTVLEAVAHYDNSANNPANPNPNITVEWGDQTWEEMMIGFFNMARANQDLSAPKPTRKERFARLVEEYGLEVDPKLDALARRALASDEDFALFWDRLLDRMPQLARMDITSVKGFALNIDFVVQHDELPSFFARKHLPRGLNRMGITTGLYGYGNAKRLVVNETLEGVNGVEMQFFKRIFGSSVHVPLTIEGRSGTVNFWSFERDAFTPGSVEFLRDLVDRMMLGQAQRTSSATAAR